MQCCGLSFSRLLRGCRPLPCIFRMFKTCHATRKSFKVSSRNHAKRFNSGQRHKAASTASTASKLLRLFTWCWEFHSLTDWGQYHKRTKSLENRLLVSNWKLVRGWGWGCLREARQPRKVFFLLNVWRKVVLTNKEGDSLTWKLIRFKVGRVAS